MIDAEIHESTLTLCSDGAFMLLLNNYRITVRLPAIFQDVDKNECQKKYYS